MLKKKKRKFVLIAVAVLIIAVILSSFVYLNSQQNNKQKVESIIFGDLHTDSSELVYIAQDQHFFTENNINLTIKNFEIAGTAINSLLKNEVNLTTSGEYPFVINIASNQNLSIIGTTDKFTAFYLIGNKNQGIENIADLKGKSIGVVRQSLMEFYLGRFLDLNGLGIHQVSLVDVNPSQWVNAIENGTVDAVVVNQAYLSQVQTQLSDQAVVWQVQSTQLAYGVIYGQTDWINQHQELINRFLKSLAQAEDYLMNHENNAKTILQNRLNYDDTYLSEVCSNHQFSLSLDQSLLLAMQDEATWLISNNLTNATAVPNFLNYVYLDGLLAVKPDAVTIIH